MKTKFIDTTIGVIDARDALILKSSIWIDFQAKLKFH